MNLLRRWKVADERSPTFLQCPDKPSSHLTFQWVTWTQWPSITVFEVLRLPTGYHPLGTIHWILSIGYYWPGTIRWRPLPGYYHPIAARFRAPKLNLPLRSYYSINLNKTNLVPINLRRHLKPGIQGFRFFYFISSNFGPGDNQGAHNEPWTVSNDSIHF